MMYMYMYMNMNMCTCALESETLGYLMHETYQVMIFIIGHDELGH